MDQYQPHLALVHFKEPDTYGHKKDWESYIKSIQETDSLLNELWDYLQQDSHYQNNTTLFLTNDHGRHSDRIATGFKGHGDDCEGCRHINFFAIGPSIKSGLTMNQNRSQVDISATAAAIMGFSMPPNSGKVMEEIFETKNY